MPLEFWKLTQIASTVSLRFLEQNHFPNRKHRGPLFFLDPGGGVGGWAGPGTGGRAGQGRAGQGRAGQGRAGQGRAVQGRAGQGRAGQGRAGQGGGGRGEEKGGGRAVEGGWEGGRREDRQGQEILVI